MDGQPASAALATSPAAHPPTLLGLALHLNTRSIAPTPIHFANVIAAPVCGTWFVCSGKGSAKGSAPLLKPDKLLGGVEMSESMCAVFFLLTLLCKAEKLKCLRLKGSTEQSAEQSEERKQWFAT